MLAYLAFVNTPVEHKRSPGSSLRRGFPRPLVECKGLLITFQQMEDLRVSKLARYVKKLKGHQLFKLSISKHLFWKSILPPVQNNIVKFCALLHQRINAIDHRCVRHTIDCVRSKLTYDSHFAGTPIRIPSKIIFR